MSEQSQPSAREEMLARIRSAIGDDRPTGTIPRTYRGAGGKAPADLPALLTDRLVDYRARVRQVPADSVASAMGELVADRGARTIVVPDGFPLNWIPHGIMRSATATLADLDEADGVVTTCAVAIAETGTIVLDHGAGQGERAMTLVPDYHLVVVRARQIVPGVPDAVAQLNPTRPQTWISGPSATSDIELDRVEGVHGPRRLDVLIIDD